MGIRPYTDVELSLITRNAIGQRVRYMYLRRLDLAIHTEENYYFAYPHHPREEELRIEKKKHEELFGQMQANCEKAYQSLEPYLEEAQDIIEVRRRVARAYVLCGYDPMDDFAALLNR